ncbi:DUF523 and DUF1722 domain-containing protein [Candidatus Woesearchaeota archaeon]|nr:DUF523 and DUF1722 domain-containing protein [Candidatus Woesearchaeota archaeon]
MFSKPKVVVSKCLGFAKCRWNGTDIPDSFVKKLRKHVSFIAVCPEVEIGLGIPRDPIRIVNKRLIQPKTGQDVTGKMNTFSEKFFKKLEDIDGFILKYKSPSCGMKNVPIYPSKDTRKAKSQGPGFFGKTVLEKFKGLPIEDEGRLRNFKIREHFLTSVFTLADFRKVKKAKSIPKLLDFHTRNKFLLMACNQKELKILGQILANQGKNFRITADEYEEHLKLALSKIPRYTANTNVLLHAYNHFSKKLKVKEKKYFHHLIKEYRDAKIPLSAILVLLQDWIMRFEDEYLAKQTFLQPYPEDLIDITDSGKGRDR